VEIVPGVTAASAAAADLGVSLTLRGVARSLTIVTPRVGARESASDWTQAVRAGGTIAIYMGAGQAVALRDQLLAAQVTPSLPAVIVENASLPTSRKFIGTVDTLPALAAQVGAGPALIVLGEALRELVRRATENASELIAIDVAAA
jgi:uroporphyrin-III C-methyltransferase